MTFDRPLIGGVSNKNNWFVRQNNFKQPVQAPPIIAGNQVTALTNFPVLDIGPDVVTFTPPPFDVVATNGLPAAAFADFPLTVVP